MARFLIVDNSLAFEVARRLKEEEHNVKYFSTWKRVAILEEDVRYMEGFDKYFGIERVSDYLSHTDWADAIIFTDVNFGEEKDWLREKGYPVFGASKVGEDLEIDREKGNESFKKLGLKLIPQKKYRNPQEALKDVKEGKGYVIRLTSGLEGEIARTFVAEYSEVAKYWLETLTGKGYDEEVILQELIEGIEVSVGGFFNGKEWATLPCIVFEEKKSLAWGMGFLCGETGSTLYFGDEGIFINKVYKKMEEYLRGINAGCGNYDINTIITFDGEIYPLEWTCRFGFPTIYIQHPLFEDFGELLLSCVKGKKYKKGLKTDWAIGVCWCAGTHPHSSLSKEIDGVPILGVLDCIKDYKFYRDDKYLAIDSIGYDDGKTYLTPSPGRTVTCVGVGKTLKEAQENALEVARRVYIPEGYYRKDIGDRVFYQQVILNELGFLKKEVL
jgi:phosphoribosylamine--glycine ligase